MNFSDSAQMPHPGHGITLSISALLFLLLAATFLWLLSVDDPVALKVLIEDSGPVQLLGQTCIALAFLSCLVYAIVDAPRRASYLPLSYLLLFYTLREADYHYKVSPYAKATQFKRFYTHELIPLPTKLMMATLVILFLVVLYRYLKREKPTLIRALRQKLPWAIYAVLWAGCFVLSQIVDQLPMLHNVIGQVFEEVFESSAEVLALIALILFRVQLRGNRREDIARS